MAELKGSGKHDLIDTGNDKRFVRCLTGTGLSGALYQWQGLEACLWASVALVLAAGLLSRLLPESTAARLQRAEATA